MAGPESAPVSEPLEALEQAIATAAAPELAALLGELERLKAAAWRRLVARVVEASSPRELDPLEELRHVTPQQVAELLSLKPAYVHELCRTHRLPARKSGKYWMIPAAGLRRWLASREGDIDARRAPALESVNPREGVAAEMHTPAPRRRRPAGRGSS
jgi:excisionase family DNA binding protein